MVTRREALASVGSSLVAGFAGCARTGTETPPSGTTTGEGTTMTSPTFESPAFEAGESIPTAFTCEGEDRSPPLAIGDVPDDAGTLAIVVDDPDAPSGTFTHWLLWNVPADADEIPADVEPSETAPELGDDVRQGANDFGSTGYRGPCPPEGDAPHTYRFQLYALESDLRLGGGAEVGALREAMTDLVLGTAEFTGTFGR